MILLMFDTQSSQNHTQKVEQWLPGGWGRGTGGLLFNGYRISVWDGEKVLEMDGAMGCRRM